MVGGGGNDSRGSGFPSWHSTVPPVHVPVGSGNGDRGAGAAVVGWPAVAVGSGVAVSFTMRTS